MVVLHPLPHDLTCWLFQTAHFSSWFRTIAIDLPGHGKSPAALSGVTMPEIAEACWHAVDQAAPGEPIVLVGLSVGSGVAKHMVNLRPRSVLALVLTGAGFCALPGAPERPGPKGIAPRHVDSYRSSGTMYRRAHLARNFSEAFRETPLCAYIVDLVLARDRTRDTDGIVQVMLAHEAPDPEWLHPGIRVPTLVLTGSEDRSVSEQLELHRRIAGSEFHLIEGAGHCCNIERPWEYDRRVREFLARQGLLA